MREIYRNNGFLCELRGMTMVCWWHAGTGSLLRSRGARVPALCYSRVYVTDVLTYWSYLQQPAFKGYGAHKKTDSFFFVYLEVVVFSMLHTHMQLSSNSHIKRRKTKVRLYPACSYCHETTLWPEGHEYILMECGVTFNSLWEKLLPVLYRL